jgi:hypothetical protein
MDDADQRSNDEIIDLDIGIETISVLAGRPGDDAR